MATPLMRLLPELRRIAAPPASDADLLGRFVRQRDETAFTLLVERHWPMVQHVCRRVLGDAHAAEDACQATFLVLARKAAAVGRPAMLAGWLYRVAHRVALKARCANCRWHATSARAVPRDAVPDPLSELTGRELLVVLEEELQRLPETYRMAVVCCCLESLTLDEAAVRLGCTAGALRGRLERGRACLHRRLLKRGLTLPAVLAAAEIARGSTTASAVAVTVKAALAFGSPLAGTAPIPVEAVRLANAVLRGTAFTYLKAALVLSLALGVAAVGVGMLSQPPPAVPRPQAAPPPQPAREKPRTDRQGDPLPAGAVMRLGTVRLRNSESFLGMHTAALAYTRDGRAIVSGGWGGAAVWDAATGKLIRRVGIELPQSFGPAHVSPDDKLVAIGGWGPERDTAGAVYEIGTGRRLYSFGNLGSQHVWGRFSPDGKILAAYGTDNEIQLHDAGSGRRLRPLAGHKFGQGGGGTVVDVVFTPDSKTLISAGGDGTIRLWDIATAKEKKQMLGGAEGIRQVALSDDGALFASQAWVKIKQGVQDGDHRIRVWEVASGKEAGVIQMPPRKDENSYPSPRLLGFTPDGSLITSADGVVRVWHPRTGKQLRQWSDKESPLLAVAFAPDGKTFAAVEGHQALRIRDYATGRELLPLVGHRNSVRAIAVAADGRTVATAGDDQAVFVWDALTGKQLRRLTGFDRRVRFMAFAPDSRTVFAAGDAMLAAWDAATGQERYRRVGHENAPYWATAALSTDGKTLAWAAEEKAILLLDADTGKDLRKLDGSGRNLEGLAFAPDNNTLLGWTGDERLHAWNPQTGECRVKPCKALQSVRAVAFSPDTRRAAFGGHETALVLADLTTGKEVARIANVSGQDADAVNAIAFSPDGRTLAWAGPRDGVVRLTEVATGKERRRLVGHRGNVQALAFTAAGTMLVSGGADTTCLVWDLTGPPAALNDASLAACWEDLKSEDAARAYLAQQRLIGEPVRSASYLGQRLRPAPPGDAKRIARLLADLDSEDFARRDDAVRELTKIGELALPALRELLLRTPPLEVRRRAERLVESLESLDAERLRTIRAVETLEYLATPQARTILRELAEGAPGPRQTQEAQAALVRLSKGG